MLKLLGKIITWLIAIITGLNYWTGIYCLVGVGAECHGTGLQLCHVVGQQG